MKTTDLITLKESITQGKWHIGRISGETAIYGKLGEHIATNPDMLPKDEIIANAQAIALTPQLIAEVIRLREALTSCLDWMEFTIPRLNTTPSGSIERMNYGGPINKARTALENT